MVTFTLNLLDVAIGTGLVLIGAVKICQWWYRGLCWLGDRAELLWHRREARELAKREARTVKRIPLAAPTLYGNEPSVN